ncbi:hypothetical protein DMR_18540 [Solidesulfovibrio magneticus RS-1]|uniref:GGDEF domain-containing protein n=1 Tax=Solidesulfovibrio magneticus (strain ATCC 700980 / DSM 13731 / RS-1) TaxID=573370 RepID=C4XQI0_SOLM1|nr:hypothetical protein DMR_18540 [Solidesulfovibrio magneticus RS-1]
MAARNFSFYSMKCARTSPPWWRKRFARPSKCHAFPLPNGATIHKTVSVGFAEYPTDAASFYKAIKFADVALYKAKEGGRNKVLCFEQSMWRDQEY